MIQLVYVSSACRPFSHEDIEDILTVSRRNNAHHNITGVLLYKSGAVIQVLEGPDEIVRERFEVIRADGRHERVTLIYDQPLAEREFPDWTMGFRLMETNFSSAPDGYNAFLDAVRDALPINLRSGRRVLHTFATFAR
jgi:hypothetical protein